METCSKCGPRASWNFAMRRATVPALAGQRAERQRNWHQVPLLLPPSQIRFFGAVSTGSNRSWGWYRCGEERVTVAKWGLCWSTGRRIAPIRERKGTKSVESFLAASYPVMGAEKSELTTWLKASTKKIMLIPAWPARHSKWSQNSKEDRDHRRHRSHSACASFLGEEVEAWNFIMASYPGQKSQWQWHRFSTVLYKSARKLLVQSGRKQQDQGATTRCHAGIVALRFPSVSLLGSDSGGRWTCLLSDFVWSPHRTNCVPTGGKCFFFGFGWNGCPFKLWPRTFPIIFCRGINQVKGWFSAQLPIKFNRKFRANIVTSGNRATFQGLLQQFSIANLLPMSWIAALTPPPRIYSFLSIAYSLRILWLAPLQTSSMIVQKFSIAYPPFKVARNEVENASFAQRSAHRDSRIWRPELIEPAAERKRRARGRRPTFKSAYPDPQILPQCNISSNYPL